VTTDKSAYVYRYGKRLDGKHVPPGTKVTEWTRMLGKQFPPVEKVLSEGQVYGVASNADYVFILTPDGRECGV